MLNKIKLLNRCVTLYLLVCLLLLTLSCSTKSPMDKWHEMYNEEWAQTQLEKILSPYLHMDWDKASLKITLSNVESPIIEEYGTCREYGNTRLKVYSVWCLPFDNANDAYPISLHVSYGKLTVLSRINNGPILIEMDSVEFARTIRDLRQEQQRKVEEEKVARQERKNAVDLAYKNKTKVHFGMSSKDYNDCDILLRENFVNGLIGEGAFNSHFEPYLATGKFVGFKVSNTSFTNLLKKAKMIKRKTYDESHRYTIIDTDYSNDLYNARVSEIIPKGKGKTSTTIDVWWNGYSKIYTK